MKTRRLTPVLLVGLATACAEPTPTTEEKLCQRYCSGQLDAVPTNGATSCQPSSEQYADECVRTCTKDIDAIREGCRTYLVLAYGCGADHSWFCVPKEGGGHTFTQFDTCREAWDTVYACEKASADAGTP